MVYGLYLLLDQDKWFRNDLIKILEIGARNNAQFILVSKLLEYDPKVADCL